MEANTTLCPIGIATILALGFVVLAACEPPVTDPHDSNLPSLGVNQERGTWGYWQGPGASTWYVSDTEIRMGGLYAWTIGDVDAAAFTATAISGMSPQKSALTLTRLGTEAFRATPLTSSTGKWTDYPFTIVKIAGAEISFSGIAGQDANALPRVLYAAKALSLGSTGSIKLIVSNLSNASDSHEVEASATTGVFTVQGAIPTDEYSVAVAGDPTGAVTVTPQHDGAQVGEVPIGSTVDYSIKSSPFRATSASDVLDGWMDVLIQGRSAGISATLNTDGTPPHTTSEWRLFHGTTQLGSTLYKELDNLDNEIFQASVDETFFSNLDIPVDPGYTDIALRFEGRIRSSAYGAFDTLIYTDVQSLRIYVDTLRIHSIDEVASGVSVNRLFAAIVTPDRRFQELTLNFYYAFENETELPRMKGDYYLTIAAAQAPTNPMAYRIGIDLTSPTKAETGTPTANETVDGDAGPARTTAFPLVPGDLLAGSIVDGNDIDCLRISVP